MTQEEKQLLIKDLCARLPYGIYVQHKNCPNTKFKVIAVFDDGRIGVTENEVQLTPTSINECKPYLRPMSSMTEEEKKELWELLKKLGMTADVKRLDWLVAHHFDIRNLIEKGFALEAPEDMYKTE